MYDLTIELQINSEKCLYEQIYEHIRQEIREGKLLMGERLPSTRSLAEHLQVARSTVDVAYGQLLSEGYIESRPYRGYFVCGMEELFQLERETGDSLGSSGSGSSGFGSSGSGSFDFGSSGSAGASAVSLKGVSVTDSLRKRNS